MTEHESDRRRVGVLLLVLGVVLLLVGAAAYLSYEQKRLPPPDRQLTEAEKERVRSRAKTPVRILLWTAGLAMGFVLAMYLFLWWSRSYRSALLRRPNRPTPVEDVWSMHKLPDEDYDRRAPPDDETEDEP